MVLKNFTTLTTARKKTRETSLVNFKNILFMADNQTSPPLFFIDVPPTQCF